MKLNPTPVKCTNAAGMTFIQYDEYMGQGQVSASIGSHSNVSTLKNPSLAYLNLLLTGLGPHYVAGGKKTFHPKKKKISCETNHDFYKMEKK